MTSLFIMSSERSGSNLLRMMLGAHSRLAAPPPPHMWRHLTEALPQYGPLTRDANFQRLVEDAVTMTQQSYAHLTWKYHFSPEQIRAESSAPTLTSVISTLYEAYAREENAAGWVCKENQLFDHAHQIREHLPDAQFIYLCRDGRDVACSIKDMPTHDQHAYAIAEEWAQQQKKCLRVHQEIQHTNGSTIVRYEDLIESPESTIQKICDFAGLEYEKRMLYFHETEEAVQQAQKSEYWENLSKPVMSDNKAKFRDQLSAREIRIFESVAGELLDLLGYPLTTQPEERQLALWQRGLYRLRNEIQSLLKQQELSEWEGREKRKTTLDRIHNRTRSDPDSTFVPPFSYE
ncbi:hypothetical protein BSZ35_00420 [Salinibacter sp. 10B]|uniref:sulfotransferase family protein n=1 Tax=Salinibacter sp. 10B TaxID=1923971 RepID=UPI000CF526CB|nr:sulfotransferase [Salinibacter sp. 10B]PQJ33266.1 hypothetical protein BSZ35_00420 [Salinibacter sp. 10B]